MLILYNLFVPYNILKTNCLKSENIMLIWFFNLWKTKYPKNHNHPNNLNHPKTSNCLNNPNPLRKLDFWPVKLTSQKSWTLQVDGFSCIGHLKWGYLGSLFIDNFFIALSLVFNELQSTTFKSNFDTLIMPNLTLQNNPFVVQTNTICCEYTAGQAGGIRTAIYNQRRAWADRLNQSMGGEAVGRGVTGEE